MNPCSLCRNIAEKSVRYRHEERGITKWIPLFLCHEHLSPFKKDTDFKTEKVIESLLGKGIVKEEYKNDKQTYRVATDEEWKSHIALLKVLRLKQIRLERMEELKRKWESINKPIVDYLMTFDGGSN